MVKLPTVIAGRYLPVRLIAEGGMGAVYEVEHARTGERLALKVLLSGVDSSPEAFARFKREARASALIKSEHVVRITDADIAPELNGAPFLVMELLEGSDLERAATASRPTPATVVAWLRQVAVAVDKAHRLGIVHRDLKPENLFLTSIDGRPPFVKVLDFGIVKMTEDGSGTTGAGQIVGTPRYMAPEQVSADKRITPAADRYALGLVAYRLLTGEGYYDGDVMTILAQLLHEPLRQPSLRHPNLGPAFDRWFAKACHRSPEERFVSAAEQVEALSAVLELPTLEIAARQEPGNPSGVAKSRRRPGAPIGLAVIVVVAATVVVAVFLNRHSRVPRPGTPPPLTSTAPAPPNTRAGEPSTTARAIPVAYPHVPGPGQQARAFEEPPVPAASGAFPPAKSRSRPARERSPGSLSAAETGAPPPNAPIIDPYADQK